LLLLAPVEAAPAPLHARPRSEPAWDPIGPPTATSWLAQGLARQERFCLSAPPDLTLLVRYQNPSVERVPEWRSYYRGRYGAQSWSLMPALTWDADEPRSARLSLTLRYGSLPEAGVPGPELAVEPAPTPEWIGLARQTPCPAWRKPRPVTIASHGTEVEALQLLECDGSIAEGAVDRLSVLARPPGVARPELPLPLDPAPGSDGSNEWLPGVKLLHPRLLWLLQQIADAFPGRPIYIVSGYRRDPGSSLHRQGRALDLSVQGVDDERLFRVCHELRDVGCGFYPNHRFVHVDVRPFGAGHPMWIDVSEPGQPSRMVDAWPGIAEGETLRVVAEQ
jgi:hypothetical protein